MNVRDNTGKILYLSIETNNSLKVYDSKNKLLGYCENGISRKANSQVVAYSESPGLLVWTVKVNSVTKEKSSLVTHIKY
jgi:hypothetical protein